MTNCVNDWEACSHCNIWPVQMKQNKVLSEGKKRKEEVQLGPDLLVQQQIKDEPSQLMAHLMTPFSPTGYSLLLPPRCSYVLTSTLSLAFDAPGRSALAHYRGGESGESTDRPFPHCWKNRMSRETKAKPPIATAAISGLFISWPSCFVLVVTVATIVKDISRSTVSY